MVRTTVPGELRGPGRYPRAIWPAHLTPGVRDENHSGATRRGDHPDEPTHWRPELLADGPARCSIGLDRRQSAELAVVLNSLRVHSGGRRPSSAFKPLSRISISSYRCGSASPMWGSRIQSVSSGSIAATMRGIRGRCAAAWPARICEANSSAVRGSSPPTNPTPQRSPRPAPAQRSTPNPGRARS